MNNAEPVEGYEDLAKFIAGAIALLVLPSSLVLSSLFLITPPEALPPTAGFEATVAYLSELDDFLFTTAQIMNLAILASFAATLVCGIVRRLMLEGLYGASLIAIPVAAFILFFHPWAVNGGVKRLTPEVSLAEACSQAADTLVERAETAGPVRNMIDAYLETPCSHETLVEAAHQGSLPDGHPLHQPGATQQAD